MLNTAAIRSLKATILDATEQAATDLILAKADEYIPVEEGIARASGRVVRDGNRIVITFGKDDDGTADHAPSNTYIVVLHEDAEMAHPHGGGPFFLRRAADEAAGGFAAAVARKVKGA